MIPTLQTPRLLLTPLTLADAARTQQLFPHWEIVRYLAAGVPWPYPADGALTHYTQSVLPAVERGEEWHWMLRLTHDPREHIGSIALHRHPENQRGFWLGLPWHRKGLMTEAVAAVNDFWFDVLGEPELRAPKAAANIASSRLSQRTGMRLAGTTHKKYVSGWLPTELWQQTAAEWHTARRSLPTLA